MSIIDFIIGATLMNGMPHFVLGVWRGRILSLFGFGDDKNILYGILNFTVAMVLFFYKYGLKGLLENGIFAGALAVLLLYFIFGYAVHYLFQERHDKKTVEE